MDKILYANKPYLPEFNLRGELNPDQGGLLLLVSLEPKTQKNAAYDGYRWFLQPQPRPIFLKAANSTSLYQDRMNFKRSGLYGTHDIVHIRTYIYLGQRVAHALHVQITLKNNPYTKCLNVFDTASSLYKHIMIQPNSLELSQNKLLPF